MGNQNIKVYKDFMGHNQQWSQKIKDLLHQHNIKMVNIIGSPGCGKTSLLEKIGNNINGKKLAVLEGDPETTHDAERLSAKNIPVSQLITQGACHLGAEIIYKALQDLPLTTLDLVIVENVGNLVCPAEFDIGEHAKIAVLSITEGEDKPLKYPLLFREAECVVLSKLDLLPHLPFNLQQCRTYIRQVNARIPIFEISSFSPKGIDSFTLWLEEYLLKS